MKPITIKGYQLLHEGSIALSQVESNGIKIDTDYLQRAINHTSRRIQKMHDKLKKDEIYKIWKKQFGQRTNTGSREQLGNILFTVMDYPCSSYTKTGRPKADETTLSSVDLDFVRNYLALERLKKAKSTYLVAILRETIDGYLNPFFNLNLVRTYRGSSDHPNFQNIPVRDPKMAKLIRRAFIARKNHHIVEIDYGGIEIASTTCYHKDPRMISYIKDDTKDLHRDIAARCYMLLKKNVSKDARYCGKNMFIFPEFYGDYYIKCAQRLWEAIDKMNLKMKGGEELDLYSHLKSKGIYKLGKCDPELKPKKGTFEKHIREVEDEFWDERFPAYRDWKEKWYFAYLKKGYFDTLTGFRIEGVLSRNEAINYPAQGTAFHFLLWSLIRIQKLLKKYKMKSLIIGQIHDSIVGDIYRKELRNYLEICRQVMTIDIRKYWKWINIPLKIEAEVAPIGKSWYEKKEVKI